MSYIYPYSTWHGVEGPLHEPLSWADPNAYWVGIALILVSLIAMYWIIKHE
jgi:hypothetical protein